MAIPWNGHFYSMKILIKKTLLLIFIYSFHNTSSAELREVKSWQESRYENIARQLTEFSCGAASLATIFAHHFHQDITEDQISSNIRENSTPEKWKHVQEDGLSLLDLKKAAENFQFKATGYRATISQLHIIPTPFIAHLDTNGFKHFVVVEGASSGNIWISDSIQGKTVLSYKEFGELWSGNLLYVEPNTDSKFDQNNLNNAIATLSSQRKKQIKDITRSITTTTLQPLQTYYRY